MDISRFMALYKCSSYYYYMIVGHPEDTNADSVSVDVQEFLHHHGHVPTDAVLRLCRSHPLWLRQVRGGPRPVSLWSLSGQFIVTVYFFRIVPLVSDDFLVTGS